MENGATHRDEGGAHERAATAHSIEAEDWVSRLRATCGHYYAEPRSGQCRVRGDVRARVVRGLEIAELSGDFGRIDRTPMGIRADASGRGAAGDAGRLDAGELPDAGARAELAELLIERHLESDALSLSWLARGVRLSPRQLQRDLAARGTSFTRLVRGKRVAFAADALRRARRGGLRVRISDVALDAGFRDLSNFNRAFRAGTGVSPREFLAGDSP